MSQPTNRSCFLPELGKVDREAGEFWVANPFFMPMQGKNLSAFERNRLYLNVLGKDFLDVSFASNADIDSDSRSVIAADFDRDGAPDLLVASVGGGPLRLFNNRCPQKNRVRVELVGTKSNRSAIGSRVIAHYGGRKILRDLFAVNAFMGQAPPEMSLGLGDATKIDQLRVRWPTGKLQVFDNVPSGSHLKIVEGENKIQVVKP